MIIVFNLVLGLEKRLHRRGAIEARSYKVSLLKVLLALATYFDSRLKDFSVCDQLPRALWLVKARKGDPIHQVC